MNNMKLMKIMKTNMMNMILMKIMKLGIIFFVSLLFANSTNAQTYVVEYERDKEMIWELGSIRLGGDIFHGKHYAQSMRAEIELDAEDRTVIFKRVTFESSLSTFEPSFSQTFPFSDFGEDILIEGKIIVEITDDKALPLKLGEGNQFFISKDGWRIGISNENFSMTYEFSGPTESIEGTISFATMWRRGGRNSLAPPIIDTTNYPNEVVVINRPEWWTPWRSSNRIHEGIDGVDVYFYIGDSSIRFPDSLTFTLKPEPSEITDISILASGSILIDGSGSIGVSDSARGPFSGEIDLPAIIQPDSSAKFFKAN